MQLKCIRLFGFKSFVDATNIPVSSRMNAIVGPNGCGKSNIVDAVRWVTGEMSAKQLRGQSMSDVIFAGTSGRKPVGKAAVELIFDNSDRRISGEYAGFSEISIRREVVRDGQSAYFINGVLARRRDLVDLFLGTGLGPHSYAIIEQGMIAQLVEAKPEDMRAHLEEVAGISKYRERRRETETRMRHTKDNLDRLNDLREELDKQLRHLQRQATAAEQYKILQEEQRVLHAQTKALQWKEFEEKLNEQKTLLASQTNECEAQLSAQRELETKIEKSRLQIQTIFDEKDGVQKTFYGLGAEIARLEQQIQDKQTALKQWEKELKESAALWYELTAQSATQSATIKTLTQSIETSKPVVIEYRALAETAKNVLTDAESDMRDAQKQWDIFQTQLSESNQQYEVAKNNIQHYTVQKIQLEERDEQLKTQVSHDSLATLADEIAPLHQAVDVLKNTVADTELHLNTLAQSIKAKRNAFQEILEKQSKTQGELQKNEARYASLSALQQHQADVQRWLEKQGFHHHARLGKIIQVSPGWELAVETVLSGRLDAVCLDSLKDCQKILKNLPNGQMTFVAAGEKNTSRLSEKTIADVVTNNHHLPAWLSMIYIADDLNAALKLQSTLTSAESVITKDGFWVGQNWLHANASHDMEDSFLIREKNLKDLQKTIDTQAATLHDLTEAVANAKAMLENLEADREAAHRAFQTASNSLTESQMQLSAKKSRAEALTQQKIKIQTELAQIESQQKKCVMQLAEAQKTVLEREATQAKDHEMRDHLLSTKSDAEMVLANARADAQLKKQQHDERNMQLVSHENQLAVLIQSEKNNQRQLIQLTDRRTELEKQIIEADAPLLQWQTTLQTTLAQRVVIETALQAIESRLQAEQTELKSYEAAREAVTQSFSNLQERQQQLKMAQQEIMVRQETLKEQIAELRFDFAELIDSLPEEANFEAWNEQLAAMERKIERLGPINLAAIEEFKTLSERKVYMDQQYTDLEEALAVLADAIQKIDRETKHLFKDTFETINLHFQKLFPRIFNGGQASLELTDNDLLTTGIIVKAQPPGKRNATIHMLSGGEKTLTAIALMFSMFQLNPAPFCILDEVDAPLDDLNVGRYCQLIKEMSTETQFLIISHNKVTIETADQDRKS